MKSVMKLMAATAVIVSLHSVANAEGLTVGVSWSNFQEERWKTDEAAIKAALEAAGNKYISADAQTSAAKQLTDIESLIAQGANALIVLAQDSGAIGPAIEKATAEGIPVVGYDRLIENPDAYYITFDNKEVGRMQAREVFKVKPEGNYVFIKGASTDPNSDFLYSGQMEVLKEAIDSGKIKNVGEAYTDGWKPEAAQKNMEQFLTANNNAVDAVVSSNDGMAGGVVAALEAQGLGFRSGLRSGRRQGRSEPRRTRHADRVCLEGQPRTWQEGRRNRQRTRRWQVDGRNRRHREVLRRPEGHRNELLLHRSAADHQGKPQRRHRRWLDLQGRSMPGRCRRLGCCLQLIA